jgi:hypothetical protein
MAPPHPRCCLNVGVTGHRLDRLDEAALEASTPAIDVLMREIVASTRTLIAQCPGIFTDEPPEFRVLSGLAEGSDRHVAGVAMRHGFALHAVLPFHRASYSRDFSSGDSSAAFDTLISKSQRVFEMPGDRGEPDRAYEMAGLGILAQADLLIAIWDGGEARGPGGTAGVVGTALKRGVPVVRFDPSHWHTPSLMWSGFSAVPAEHENVADYPLRTPDRATLDMVLAHLLLPAEGDERRFLHEYFTEPQRLVRTRVEYPLMLAMTAVKPLGGGIFKARAYAPATREEWAAVEATVEKLDRAQLAATELLREAYAWADNLASHFAQSYRSGHVANFLLAAIAVMLASAGLIWPHAKLWLIVSEIAVILLLVMHTRIGRSRQWHRRWLDYRYIAERLRPMRTLKLFGLARPGRAGLRSDGNVTRWTDWYAQTLWRQLGCPSGRVDPAYRQALEALVLADELRPQIRYHEAAAGQMEMLEHRLHRAGNVIFVVTLAAGAVFLAAYFAAHDWALANAAVFTAITAALPALGGAIYGIRVQGDFGGAARRSLQTSNELARVADALASASPRFTQAADMAEMGARVMLGDLAEWQLTYRRRDLDIPG